MFTPHLTLKMSTTKDVETSFKINNNSPSQDSTNLDDLHPQTCNNTLGLYRPLSLQQQKQIDSLETYLIKLNIVDYNHACLKLPAKKTNKASYKSHLPQYK